MEINMYCSKCGKENDSTATFCYACGNRLSYQTSATQGSVGEFLRTEQELKKSSIILIIFLTVITAGIYYPVWFLKRRNAINILQSNEKLNSGVLIFAIVALSIILLLAFISGVSEELGEMDIARELDAFAMILNLVVGITLLVKCFKVRRIFNEHYNVHLKRDISFSRVATFFFQIYYLQYKINRI
jgi:uncharacterized membrane protein YbjE (DUF340 family)